MTVDLSRPDPENWIRCDEVSMACNTNGRGELGFIDLRMPAPFLSRC